MKRSYLGAGLLVCLLAVSALVSWGMERIHSPVAQGLTQAQVLAQAGDWSEAAEQESAAKKDWEQWRGLRSCLSDHGPMEQIDAQFAMLEACIQSGQREEFIQLAAQTVQIVNAMGDAHALTWGSFF